MFAQEEEEEEEGDLLFPGSWGSHPKPTAVLALFFLQCGPSDKVHLSPSLFLASGGSVFFASGGKGHLGQQHQGNA